MKPILAAWLLIACAAGCQSDDPFEAPTLLNLPTGGLGGVPPQYEPALEEVSEPEADEPQK